jgi:hypothetical protein
METSTSIPFVGKTVTFSFYARKGSNYSSTSDALKVYLTTGTGTDEAKPYAYTGATNAIDQTATLTATWQRFSYSATLSASATQIGVQLRYTPTGTASTNDYFEVTGTQIDIGSVALPFRRSSVTIQGELAACQMLSNAGWGSNNAAYVYAIFNTPVSMRSAPTSLDYGNVRFGDGSNFFAPTTMVITTNHAGNNLNLIEINYTPGGLVQFRPYYITCNTNAAGFLGVSAEL